MFSIIKRILRLSGKYRPRVIADGRIEVRKQKDSKHR